MKSVVYKAHPKINLTLDVINKRADGYHNLKMIMQSLEFYDEIEIVKKGTGISIHTNLKYLPCDRRNIAYKAAEIFCSKYGITDGIAINLEKRIPVCAGLAGGSTDAAAVLKGLNKLYQIGATLEELSELGIRLGADVPYCLYGKLALCEGIGEIITPLNKIDSVYVCLSKPDFSVSTAEIFKCINVRNIINHPDTNGMIDSINNNDIKGITLRMYNVLEEITARKHKVIKKIESRMLDIGASGTIMSGSGPTVFGVFSSEQKAHECAEAVKEFGKFSIVTKTIV